MAQAVRARLGATALPLSVARRIVGADDLFVRRIDPAITVRVSLGTQGNHTPSRPAERVRGLLRAIVRQLGAQEPGESDAQLGTPPVGQ